MKKVIEQGLSFIDIQHLTKTVLIYEKFNSRPEGKIITIDKHKAREVALAICPELGEPTIKTDNTKVILHLESELKEAVELIGKIADHEFSYDELVTFLTKHKSK